MIRHRHWQLFSVGFLGLFVGWGTVTQVAQAAAPDTAPEELTTTLEQIEAAANEQDLDEVMSHYSESFSNGDGFGHPELSNALSELWQQYDELTYRVELQSWDTTTNGYVAETATYIEGTRSTPRDAVLESVIRSRQYFEEGQIISQDILSERNQLNAGSNPPSVTVILPERVTPGDSYNFDAIVQEPLNDAYLLGVALDEGTTAEDFFMARPIDLELLSAGGLFKIGDAPAESDNLWVSALLIRDDGLVVVTRRLRVE